MTLLRYLIALASVAGLIAFLTIGTACWRVRDLVFERTESAVARISTALRTGNEVAGAVVSAIDRSEAELQRARQETKSQPTPPSLQGLDGFVLRTTLSSMPDRVKQALTASNMASEALVIANAALDTTGDWPGRLPVSSGELQTFKKRLDATSASLANAEQILRSADPRVAEAIRPDDVRVINEALVQGRDVAVEAGERLRDLQARLHEANERFRSYVHGATWGIFTLAVLGAAGQVSLIRGMLWRRRQV